MLLDDMNSNNPSLVSVVMPIYNAGEFLRPALLSIINQTYTNLEIILIDDGSTDDCLETIRDINDPRLSIIHQKNTGRPTALNRGLDALTGEYFLIQDADDISYLNRVERLLTTLQDHPELTVVYSGINLLMNGKQFAPMFRHYDPTECRESIEALKMPAHDVTGLYRVEMISDLRFDTSLRIGSGVDFVFRVGEKHAMMRLGECLYTHRVHFRSLTRQNLHQNTEKTNEVIRLACRRRGLDFELYQVKHPKINPYFKHRHVEIIISVVIESIMDLKRTGKWLKALDAAWFCIRLHPLDPYYYKPLVCALMPLLMIDFHHDRRDS